MCPRISINIGADSIAACCFCCSIEIAPGVVFRVDCKGSCIHAQSAIVLEQVALNFHGFAGWLNGKLNSVATQIMDEVIHDLEVGDCAFEVDTICSLARSIG